MFSSCSTKEEHKLADLICLGIHNKVAGFGAGFGVEATFTVNSTISSPCSALCEACLPECLCKWESRDGSISNAAECFCNGA